MLHLKKTPLRRKTPLKSKVVSWWEKVRKVLPKQNVKRAKKAKEEDFGPPGFVEFVHRQGCVVARQARTFEGCLGPIQVAHVRSRGAGGSWRDTVPLCLGHHREQHSIGVKTFAKRHCLDLEFWAGIICHEWDLKQERAADV